MTDMRTCRVTQNPSHSFSPPNKIEEQIPEMTSEDLTSGQTVKLRDDDVLESAMGRFKTDFVVIKEIGHGGFGRITLCTHLLDGMKYAVEIESEMCRRLRRSIWKTTGRSIRKSCAK